MSVRSVWEGDQEDPTQIRRGNENDMTNDDPNAPVADTPAETTVQAPTKRKRNLLSESHLLSDNGLKKIYTTFPYQVSGGVVGKEAKALNELVRMYKQWAYDLYPGLNFEDFIDRTETLGRTHSVQGLMSDLRSQEMRRAQGLAQRDFIDNQNDQEISSRDELYVPEQEEESGFIGEGHDEDGDSGEEHQEDSIRNKEHTFEREQINESGPNVGGQDEDIGDSSGEEAEFML